MGTSTRAWHRFVAVLCLITFAFLNTAQSNSLLEIGHGNASDDDNELWNAMRYCPNNSFIAGFSARFNEENTKVTAIRFYCTRQHVLSELPEHQHNKRRAKDVFDMELQSDPTGAWKKELFCEDGIVTGLQINFITTHTATDPTSDGLASDLRMLCSDGKFLEYVDNEHDHGDEYWGTDEGGKCHERQAACGFQSPFWTENGLSSVRIDCCDVPDPSVTCKPKKNWHRASHCDNPISSATKTCVYEKRIGTSYAGKDREVKIYKDLGFHLDQAGENLEAKMREVSIDPTSDNDGNADARNWLPEPSEPKLDEIDAMTGLSATVYQLIGHCGFYKIRFSSFKADVVEMEAADDGEKKVDLNEVNNQEKESKNEVTDKDNKVGQMQEKNEDPEQSNQSANEEESWRPLPLEVQNWLKKRNLTEVDLDELMQADAAWDPDDEWVDDRGDNEVPPSEPEKPKTGLVPDSNDADTKSDEVDWDLDFDDPEPTHNVPIQNSEKINAVSNPHEFVVDVPLAPAPASLVKPPPPPPAAAAHQHNHHSADHDFKPPAQVHDEDESDSFDWDDPFFNDDSLKNPAQDNRRDSSGFSALKPDDDVDVDDHSDDRSRNQQQQLLPGNDLRDEGQKIMKEISDMPVVKNVKDFVDNVKNTILDNQPGGDNGNEQHQVHDHNHHDQDQDQGDGSINELERSNADAETGDQSGSSTPAPAKVSNAILGYIVGGMVVAVCIIVIIIFVLEKRKPTSSRRSDPVKRSEYASNLEPRLLGGGDGKPSDKRITIEEKETA